MSDVVLYEVEERIATVTLNRPERLNAINPELDEALIAALLRAEADPDVRCAIVQGAGRAFCAGADTKRDESSGQPRNFTPIEDRDRLEAQYRRWMRDLGSQDPRDREGPRLLPRAAAPSWP